MKWQHDMMLHKQHAMPGLSLLAAVQILIFMMPATSSQAYSGYADSLDLTDEYITEVEEEEGTDSTKAVPGEIIRAADASTLFLVPTGYPIPAGRKVFGLYHFGVITAAFGVSDRISLSMATCLPFCLSVTEGSVPIIFSGKAVPIMHERGAISVGASFLPVSGFFTLFYATGTLKHQFFNLTAGVARSDKVEGSIVLLGFELRASSTMRLMFEAVGENKTTYMKLSFDAMLMTAGIRMHLRDLFLEIGAMKNKDERKILPWVGLSLVL